MSDDGAKIGEGAKRMTGEVPPIDLIRILHERQDDSLDHYTREVGVRSDYQPNIDSLSSHNAKSSFLDVFEYMRTEHYETVKNEKKDKNASSAKTNEKTTQRHLNTSTPTVIDDH